ncbi:MAG TPA: redoxin domain-containing protein [Candidatus Kapabacteria bacterium]|nr:redoxin domain-containing protein [Candidatus Kapabacteria bacterium]
MFKKIFILVFMALFIISCQTGKEDAKKFSDEYTKISGDLKVKRDKVKTRDDFVIYNEEMKREFETLLKKYEKSPAIEEIEILRAKILFKIKNLDEAEKKIDALLLTNPLLMNEAKMVKVQILFERKKYDEAYQIFKGIEKGIKDVNDLLDAYYNIGSEHPDNKIKEEYSNKFLNAQQIPEDLAKNKPNAYLTLAEVAKEEGNTDKARKILNDGIADIKDEKGKATLQQTLGQLDYIGQQAFPISASTWLNSAPIKLEELKGKVVVVLFWAPWCTYCRALMPDIVNIYNENKDRGFIVVGYTRLYGTYRDDAGDKGKVTKEVEIENIKNHLVRHNIPFPVGIGDDKATFELYKVPGLPTMVFIDKKGEIKYTKIGGGSIPFIKDKIKSLLQES